MNNTLSSYEKKAVIFLAVFGIIGVVMLVKKSEKPATPGEIRIVYPENTQANPQESSKKIMVHIEGAVNHPGVYELRDGDRLIDLVNKTGLQASADRTAINLAKKLKDQEKIIIPQIGDKGTEHLNLLSKNVATDEDVPHQININMADQTELMTLSGIGEKLAASIVNYREEHGPFLRMEDVSQVPGIGEKRLETIKQNLTLD